MASLEDTEEFQRGSWAERAWLDYLARNGMMAFPAYKALEDGPSKAPRVYCGDSRLIAPDILMTLGGQVSWYEVKLKARPDFRFHGPNRGWVHGIDLHLFRDHYLPISKEAHNLWLVICEEASPPEGYAPTARDYDSAMIPGHTWLAIRIEDAAKYGYEQRNWGKRGGWLWPRRVMRVVHNVS
jgi:hypothetical protein